MSEITYYVKEGRKYVPIKYYDETIMRAIPMGATLIVKESNSKMTRFNVEPKYAPYLAATIAIESKISTSLVRASESRPHSTHSKSLTEDAQKDWETFIKKYGEQFRYIEYPSAQEVVGTMFKELTKKVMVAHKNPAVLEAWNHYQFVMALALDKQVD
jgi:hypothetical protein